MRSLLALFFATLLLIANAPAAEAHCDSEGGPVATAALKALETGNVNLVLPYVPASAESELGDAFAQSRSVRGLNPEAKALSDRYFMETAVRLHRAGEGAPYTGLKPADTDFGPAIPAAEHALASGRVEPLAELLSEELGHALTERFEQARAARDVTKEPVDASAVPAARKRVSAELGFIGYVEAIYLAITGEAPHAEGAVDQHGEQHSAIPGAVQGC